VALIVPEAHHGGIEELVTETVPSETRPGGGASLVSRRFGLTRSAAAHVVEPPGMREHAPVAVTFRD
jgi:hypothetical protein